MRLRFTQPFDRIAIEAEASGLDFASREINARDIGFHLTTEPHAGLFRLDRLSLASPEGGRLEATAALERLQLEAKLTSSASPRAQVLPPTLRPAARAMVDGIFQVRADLMSGDAELVRSTLVVTRGEDEQGPRVALFAGTPARPRPARRSCASRA